MRLSEAQRRVLGLLATSDLGYSYSKGLYAHYFWRRNDVGRSPQYATVERLLNAGYAKIYSEDWKGWWVRITDAGRAALREGER